MTGLSAVPITSSHSSALSFTQQCHLNYLTEIGLMHREHSIPPSYRYFQQSNLTEDRLTHLAPQYNWKPYWWGLWQGG